jgi:hypothetical protein
MAGNGLFIFTIALKPAWFGGEGGDLTTENIVISVIFLEQVWSV